MFQLLLRILLFSGLSSLTLTLSAAPAFEDTMAQRTLACTACHGAQGRAGPDGYYPRLAGKPAGYLYNQLLNFREGRRHYGLMAGLVEPLTDSYMWEMAQYFSQLDLPYPPPPPTTLPAPVLARGQTLATQGDAAMKIPACTQCHGSALTGAAPNVPGLLGLPRDYLSAQLGGWQTRQRRAHAPDCMAHIATQLSGADVAAVTSWLAAQALPRDTRPLATLPPLSVGTQRADCGSAPRPQAVSAAQLTRPAQPAPGPSTLVSRGAYLARAGNCMGCHTVRGGTPYAGGRGIATPFGTVYSSNLTSDKASGLGNWSADDFWQALHHGRAKDGRLLNPAFPYTSYTRVTRADADALFAYLQTLPPSTQANRAHALRWPLGTQAALRVWRTLYFKPQAFVTDASQPASWNRGAYLVNGLGHCAACHTPRNALGASIEKRSLTGGLMPRQDWYAPSLRSPQEAGVADWPVPDIVALLQTGVSPHGSSSGPMAEVVQDSTQHLSVSDLTAMAAYLKSIGSPAQTAVKTPATAQATTTAVPSPGAKLYEKHCANCHGAQGSGVPGAYPALAHSRTVTMADTTNLIQTVLYGGFAPATAGNPRPFGMPPYILQLNDKDTAAVLTHLRQSWGNRAPEVTELEVNRARDRQAR